MPRNANNLPGLLLLALALSATGCATTSPPPSVICPVPPPPPALSEPSPSVPYFEQCAGRLEELAGKADRHASDALTLKQAWPKPSQP